MRLHRPILPLLSAAAAVLVVACDSDPSGPAVLRVDAVVNHNAPPTEPNIILSVQNQGLQPVYLPRCGDEVIVLMDLRVDGEWDAFPPPLCPAIYAPLELDPGEVLSLEDWRTEPGRYRARFRAQTSLDARAPATEGATEFVIR